MFNTYLLDSNILIGFLNGDQKIADWIFEQNKNNNLLLVSSISVIELLSFKELTGEKLEIAQKLAYSFHSVSISEEIINLTASIRRKNILKLGDAIIAATAISRKLTLVTNDKELVKKVNNFIKVISI